MSGAVEKLNQKEVAARLGVAPRTVRRLEGRGLPRNPDNTYDWDSVFRWYLEFKKKEAVKRYTAGGDVSYEEARTRREMARARMAEIDLGKEEDRIITREAADATYGEAMDRIRSAIMNMPGRFATQLVQVESVRQAEGILKDVAREILDHLSGPVADAVERDADELPEDFPGRKALMEVGIESVREVAHVDDLEEVHGIGPVTAGKIRDRLEDRDAA